MEIIEGEWVLEPPVKKINICEIEKNLKFHSGVGVGIGVEDSDLESGSDWKSFQLSICQTGNMCLFNAEKIYLLMIIAEKEKINE